MIARLVWGLGPARRNRGFRPHLARIEALAACDRASFDERQQAAVGEHLAWARSAVPWLRERAPDWTGAEVLSAWPILSRADVQAAGEALRDETRPDGELVPNSSGGSTGEPVTVYQDAAYWQQEFATETWLWRWWGLDPWCRKAFLWGDDLCEDEQHWKTRLENTLLGEMSLNVFDVDEPRLAQFRAEIERHRPDAIIGYASALELFADHLDRNGPLVHRPKIIRSAAEALYPERRGRIERAFGMRVTDFYGSRESASLAAEGLDGRLYVLAHGKVIELVDDDGLPVPPGEPGRVLVTDLTNRAFGLIRYENGDVASWAPEPDGGDASLLVPYPRLERVHGRTSDFITLPDGRRIHGEWFTHLFYGVAEVTRFQVRQPDVHTVRLLVEGPKGDGAAADGLAGVVAPIASRIRERLGTGVAFTWERVDEIPLTRTGKWRFTVSDVPFRAGT